MALSSVVDVMVAEHTAIRAEMNQRMAIHGALVGAAAAGLAALAVFPLEQPVDGVSLTLSVAIVGCALALMHLHHTFYIEKHATYLRRVLLPAIQRELNATEAQLPTWEQWVQREMFNVKKPWSAIVAFVTHASMQMITVAAIWDAWQIEKPQPGGEAFWWILGVVSLTVLIHVIELVVTARDRSR